MEKNQRTSEIWLPDFHPKQQFFFDSKATQILWGGDTRGGKTAGIKLSLIHWCANIPGLQCDIFRHNLSDVIASYMEGDFSFHTLMGQWEKDKLVTINKEEVKFWNGSLITLEHCSSDNAMSKHQGIPKHVRIFDEAGQIPERRMKWLSGWVSMSKEMQDRVPEKWKGCFPKIIYLSNPLGPSKPFLRKTFVKARPKYTIEQVGAFKRQYIPARVDDNPSEDAETTRLRVLEATDEATAKALLNEDWDTQTGNYYSQWDEDKHVIKPFVIPDHWNRFRTFDYGSYEPWACLWWAVASEGCQLNDTQYVPRGALVCYREWYGCKAEHPKNESDKLVTNKAPQGWSNQDMARGIQERTEERFRNQPILTDSFPFNKLGGRTIAKDFEDEGVILIRGDTDRKNGWAQLGSRLNGVKLNANSTYSFPMIYFFDSCKYCRDYLPMIERNPDEKKSWDAQDSGEPTHICDCCRLAAMTHKIINELEKPTQKAIEDNIQSAIKKPTIGQIMNLRGDQWL